jgi:hypothetical protein
MESRADITFWCQGHAEIPLEDIVESRILIYQHVYVFECDLTGEYIQDIYEYEPKQVRFGLLYKDGEVEIDYDDPCYYESNKIHIERIYIALVNTNILFLYNHHSEHKLLINLNNEKKEEPRAFPYFFCYEEALFLNKNTILVIDIFEHNNEIWEYTILNKEGINLEKYEYTKKKIFDFSMRRRKAEAIRGIKMKNKIVYFVSTSDKNYLKIFQILK